MEPDNKTITHRYRELYRKEGKPENREYDKLALLDALTLTLPYLTDDHRQNEETFLYMQKLIRIERCLDE